MRTDNDPQIINAFVDGELDLRSRLEIEERMRDDAALARDIGELRQLRESIRERADYHAAPSALRERLSGVIAPASAPASVPGRTRDPRGAAAVAAAVQRWLGGRPFAAAFSLMAILAVAANLTWLRSSSDDRLLDDVVASHVRSTLGEHLVDVASSDHHTVKPWLSSKLDFSPPVNELRIPGNVFVGGRVDYVDGRPVAALVYRQGAHVVSSFVWPSDSKSDAPGFSQLRGYQIAHWTQQGMAHWVISDVNRDEFRTLVEGLKAADAGSTN